MGGTLKWQRVVVGSGYLFVAGGYAALTLVVAIVSHNPTAGAYQNVYDGAFAVGFAAMGVATWSWFTSLDRSPVGNAMPGVLRLFAVANLIFAVGLTSVTYIWAHEAITTPYDGRAGIGIPTAYGIQLFGFLLVSVAFWNAASAVRSASRLGPTSTE